MDNNIIKKQYVKIAIVQIFSIAISAINSLIDTMITGLLLEAKVIAAIGLFSPVVTFIGISYVVITGCQILCSRYIGQGEKQKSISLFSSTTLFLMLFGAIISILCFIFRDGLASILGADRFTFSILKNYIFGYSFGIIFQILSGLLMVFLALNGDMKYSYLSIVVMFFSNTILNIVFIKFLNLGSFGLGLATSISYFLSFISIFPLFLNKNKFVYFKLASLCFDEFGRTIFLGLPSLMFTLGNLIKSYIINISLMDILGKGAVAVMNVNGNMCSLFSAIPMGCANVFLYLGSYYYGEEDEELLLSSMRYSLKIGIILSSFVTVFLMSFSKIISNMFFKPYEEANRVCIKMLLLFPIFFILNVVFSLFTKIYQIQSYLKLINILSFSENILIALFSVIFIEPMGSDAVWISFAVADAFCIIVIAISVFINSGEITFSLKKWMKLKDDFGPKKEDFVCFLISSIEESKSVLETLANFCIGKGLNKNTSNLIFSVAKNRIETVIGRDSKHNTKNQVYVRVINKDPDKILEVRIKDNLCNFGAELPAIPENLGELTHEENCGVSTINIKIKKDA